MSTRPKEVKQTRIGFVGCGTHATSALYPAIHMVPEIDLVAVCDLKEELARRNARNFGARKWYTDLDKMLSKENLEGVVIVGTPQVHCQVGKQCLDAGLPVFVEKPSAISCKEALSLAEYAEDKGLFGAVGYMKRHSTCYRMAKAITEKEKFGKINKIEINFFACPYPSVIGELWDVEEVSRVYLFGIAIHIFNLVRFFCGEIDEVYARLNQVDEEHFNYTVTIIFKSGVVGIINLSSLEFREEKVSEYLAISGFECWVEVKDMISLNYYPRIGPIPEFNKAGRNQMLTWQPDWTELMATKAEGAFGYTGELQNFARAVLNLEKPTADLWDGAKDLQIAEAVWESSQAKRPVKIKEL